MQFRQTVAKEHNLGSFAVSRRGGRVSTSKPISIISSSGLGIGTSGSNSNSNSNNNNDSSSVGDNGTRLERADSLDISISNMNRFVNENENENEHGHENDVDKDKEKNKDKDGDRDRDIDTIKMDVIDDTNSTATCLQLSPSSSAKMMKESMIAASQANRAIAINVGLVGAGMSDMISRCVCHPK